MISGKSSIGAMTMNLDYEKFKKSI